MIDRWNVFNKVSYVGVLEYYEKSQKFFFEQRGFSESANQAVEWLNLDKGPEIIKDTILNCRIFPPGRMNADELLKKFGLKEYDAWEIAKATHLINICDCVWMTKGDNPLEFFDLHPAARWIMSQSLLNNDANGHASKQREKIYA